MVGFQVITIQGRASEENDHHAEIWVAIDEDFASHAARVMVLREDGVWRFVLTAILTLNLA